VARRDDEVNRIRASPTGRSRRPTRAPIPPRNGDGDIVITWSAENARTYRVQYKDDLNASAWSNLSDVTASSPVASTTEVIGAGSQRFYRIQLLNP